MLHIFINILHDIACNLQNVEKYAFVNAETKLGLQYLLLKNCGSLQLIAAHYSSLQLIAEGSPILFLWGGKSQSGKPLRVLFLGVV
jgi:hypothetical protein